MSTSFFDVYKKFLGMVDDYELNLAPDYDLNEVLYGYLDQARSLYFTQCNKDLDTTIVDDNNEVYFNNDLTAQEQYILAMCMKKSWLSDKVYNADLMRRDIGDRDYKAVQGTTYIEKLSALEKKIDEEIRVYTIAYTYKDFSLDGW